MESAVLELVHDWEGVLETMIKISNMWLVFHRLFYTNEKTKFEQVKTYLGIPDIRIHIGLNDLNKILEKQNFKIVKQDKWEINDDYNMGTFVAKKNI